MDSMKKDEIFYINEEPGWEKDSYQNYCVKKFNFMKKFLRGKILDSGCGIGWFYKKYDKKKNVTNLDFVKRDLPNFKKSELTKLPFKKNSFDTVVCLDVLEHLTNGEDMKVLNELLRVGKRVVISTAFGNNLFRFFSNPLRKLIGVLNNIFRGHFIEYDEKKFIAMLKKKGKIVASKNISMPCGFMPLTDFLKNNKIFYTKIIVIDSK